MLMTSREGPKVPKWVSDIYFVNIGHLDHHVVFGTKFGIVQDFQRGKKGPIWVQQTPLDLPYTPKTPHPPRPDPPNHP